MRIMGIDYGTKRIGVAISAPLTGLAHPLEIVPAAADGGHFKRLKAIAVEYEVSRIVVGLPYSMDGSLGLSAEKAQDLGRQLGLELGLPVEFWDERLTTAEAHSLMSEHGVNSKKRRQVVDKIAASLILQAYLDAHPYEEEK